MGYTTEFKVRFEITDSFTKAPRRLLDDEVVFLRAFAGTRRMKRDRTRIKAMIEKGLVSDEKTNMAGLGLGAEGGYFVDGGVSYDDDSVLDTNSPPQDQPGLLCQWVPSEDCMAIEWDGAEKFYNYLEWLQYIIKHFLSPWGYDLTGQVEYQGEDPDDFGSVETKNGHVWQSPRRRTIKPKTSDSKRAKKKTKSAAKEIAKAIKTLEETLEALKKL